MTNHYPFASRNKEKYYWSISPKQASELIHEYNIYFNYCAPELPTHTQEFDYYKLFNDKSFDEQYEHIKTLKFPFQNRIFFYTDHKTNETILKRKIIEARQLLEQKNKSLSMTNIHKVTKLKKEVIKKLLDDEKNINQGVLNFD
jgi:hypothetical protein